MPFALRRDDTFGISGRHQRLEPQHAWSDNNTNDVFFLMTFNESRGCGGIIYKLKEDYSEWDDLGIMSFHASSFFPLWQDAFLLGTTRGHIQFVDKDPVLVSLVNKNLMHGFDAKPIKKIFHTSGETVFLAQSEDGIIDYFDIILAPDRSAIQIRTTRYAGWLVPEDPSALITDVLRWPDAEGVHFHAILIKNKIFLVDNYTSNKIDEFTLSARALAITWVPAHNTSIYCVLENGTIEIVSFRRHRDLHYDFFDQDLSQTIDYQRGRDVVAACFLKEEELIVLLLHAEGSNDLTLVVMNFGGEVLCSDNWLEMGYNQTELYDPKLIPAYDTNNFIVSFRHKMLGENEFFCYTAKFSVIITDDGGAAPAAGGGAAPVRRGAKRPAPADDAPEFVKKAYLMEILSHLPKEEREALLQMTPDMQEKLKAESCSICLRDYNSKVTDKDEVTPVVAECGHIVCDDCAPQLPDGSCPECRVPFRKAEFELLLV